MLCSQLLWLPFDITICEEITQAVSPSFGSCTVTVCALVIVPKEACLKIRVAAICYFIVCFLSSCQRSYQDSCASTGHRSCSLPTSLISSSGMFSTSSKTPVNPNLTRNEGFITQTYVPHLLSIPCCLTLGIYSHHVIGYRHRESHTELCSPDLNCIQYCPVYQPPL